MARKPRTKPRVPKTLDEKYGRRADLGNAERTAARGTRRKNQERI